MAEMSLMQFYYGNSNLRNKETIFPVVGRSSKWWRDEDDEVINTLAVQSFIFPNKRPSFFSCCSHDASTDFAISSVKWFCQSPTIPAILQHVQLIDFDADLDVFVYTYQFSNFLNHVAAISENSVHLLLILICGLVHLIVVQITHAGSQSQLIDVS